MGIKLTWTISTIIAVSSFVSSVVVALINNKQQQKIHEMDLDDDKSVAELRVKQEIFHSQTEKNYTDKKNAYIRFIEAAGNFVYDPSDSQSYVDLLTASSNVILFCTDKTHKLLSDFITYTENFTECRILPDDELKNYHQNLSKLSLAFREELENLRFSD